MSRIGKLPVMLVPKVEASISWNTILIKWEKWELKFTFSDKVEVKIQENIIVVSPKWDDAKALWGTTRSIISNMVIWVSQWYKKSLEINGVGYKFEIQADKLILSIGFSHKVEMDIPAGLTLTMDEKLKNTIHISGIDKQKVGQFSAKIKVQKKPEPYKGKWIKYQGEHIRRKAGKTGSK